MLHSRLARDGHTGLFCAFWLGLFVACLWGSVAQAQAPDRLAVSESDGVYRLTVPVSRLELLIPGTVMVLKPLNMGGSTANPRYFHFDSGTGSVLSGWFEPSNRYRGLKQLWEGEADAWRSKGLPMPVEFSFERRGQWEVVFYNMALSGGSSAHARANWVEAGTWIDVHLSVTGPADYATNRKTVEGLLSQLTVREKPAQ